MILGMDSNYFGKSLVERIIRGEGAIGECSFLSSYPEIRCMIPRFVLGPKEQLGRNMEKIKKILESLAGAVLCIEETLGKFHYEIRLSVDWIKRFLQGKRTNISGKFFKPCLKESYRLIENIVLTISGTILGSLKRAREISTKIPKEVVGHLRERYWEIKESERSVFQLYHLDFGSDDSGFSFVDVFNDLLLRRLIPKDERENFFLPQKTLNFQEEYLDWNVKIFSRLNYLRERFNMLSESESGRDFYLEVLSENC